MLYVVVCHDEHSVRALLPIFIVALCHSPEIFAECSLPHLSRGGVIHQSFLARYCLSGHQMDHWVGIVLTFVYNWDDCMFDERRWCED
jgi:hypothetical protein